MFGGVSEEGKSVLVAQDRRTAVEAGSVSFVSLRGGGHEATSISFVSLRGGRHEATFVSFVVHLVEKSARGPGILSGAPQ